MPERYCLDCSSKLTGRSDKKFCSDACRINYHNHQRKNNEQYIRFINKQLKLNRSILERHFMASRSYVPLNQLHLEGLQEKYHTHTANNGLFNIRYFYEYGISFENAHTVRIWKEEFPVV